ncbi:MAG: hypothetical protein ACE5HP_12155 [Gemmatimonadota bacterium]
MRRLGSLSLSLLWVVPAALGGQDAKAEAMSAAPAEVAAHATILDSEGNVLQEGTNGYTCFPTPPGLVAPQPMCLDAVWTAWAEAWRNGTEPPVGQPGVAYMLGGDGGVSNSDPAGFDPEAADDWVRAEQHLMVLLPDRASYEAFPTDPSYGGPWVMWKGTPYVHLMIPISDVEYEREGKD